MDVTTLKEQKSLVVLVAKVFYLLLLLAQICSSLDEDQPYCSLRYRRLCQGKGRHVACAYPYSGPGPSCQNYTKIVFTAELRHFVINYINKRRQRIAAGTERVKGGALIPKPQVMLMVVWDRELAFLAQRLADQCSFIHDDCRATVRYPYAGQTVGEVRWRGESDATVQRAMRRVFDAWWGEKRRVRPQQLVTPFKLGPKGAAWGHFSQLAVWALAAAGCGAARHGGPRRLLLVCDFSHTNMLGQSTLVPGEMAPCPLHYARRSRSPYPLLCAPVQTRKPESGQEKNDGSTENDEEYATSLADYEDVSTIDDENITRISFWTTSKRRQTVAKSLDEQETRNIFKNVTRPHIINKIEQHLLKKESIGPHYTHHHQSSTNRFHFGNVRENHEDDVMLSKAKFKIHIEEPYYNAPDITTEIVRKKWKQTRHRPRRPGADALLSKPVEKVLHRSTVPSLNLDKDDMEQLFQDTGFHKHWKNQPPP